MTRAESVMIAKVLIEDWFDNCSYKTIIRERDCVRLINAIARELYEVQHGKVSSD